ncbi:uncharacterized protein LOC136095622 [Hydra vulgaris]|uniref:uncharacterized protein LOC136095622 n=1 Tax=Hydra vulgaris TaxID=6087 RepID=UPI0032EA078C
MARSKKKQHLNLVPKNEIKNACILHQGEVGRNNNKLRVFTENALAKVKNACQNQNDFKIIDILPDTYPTTLLFHQRCDDKYVNIKTLNILQLRKNRAEKVNESVSVDNVSSSKRRISARKRDRSGKIIADIECCICYCKKTYKYRNGYETLTKCVTESAANMLIENAVSKSDNQRLMASILGTEWQTIISLELYYHRSCYLNYTRPQKVPFILTEDAIMRLLFDYVKENVLDNLEVIHTSKLSEFYKEKCTDKTKISD